MKKEILKFIAMLWELYPEQRFGQLLVNYVFDNGEIFYQEDKESKQKIKRQIELKWKTDSYQ